MCAADLARGWSRRGLCRGDFLGERVWCSALRLRVRARAEVAVALFVGSLVNLRLLGYTAIVSKNTIRSPSENPRKMMMV